MSDIPDSGLRFGDHARVSGDAFTGGKHEYHNETIYNTVLRGPDELPTRYDARVQSFLEYYLGTPERPVPFGGRANTLAALDDWLADPGAPPYTLLAAPAGRGKSGLLAHWVARLSERAGGPHLVYFPISVRFQTNTESVVFASLAARLAHLHGEKVSPLVDAQQYRGLFADYLRRAPPQDGRLLVVIDGLDEAGGWEAGADLFPIAPPPHLRVVAAARLMAGDPDGSAWLAQLGWEQPGLAQRLPLDALDRAGVADVLAQLAGALGEQAKNSALIDRLFALSEGDPLLVRLYAGALLPQGEQPAAFKPSDLDHLAPGLKSFLKQWMKEQMALWGPTDPTESETVQGVLDACAMALGPLRRDDLLALDNTLFLSGRVVARAVRPLSRLIIGDAESGYVFSHPRLDEYFVDEMSKSEREVWDGKFLAYGRRTLAALADGSLAPAGASPYLLEHYGAHLEQARSPSADIYALLAQGWLRAHETVLGTPSGFLDDARRVARRAKSDGPTAVGQQVRAALSFASIAAIGTNVAPDLLEACARAGVISTAAALVLARQKSSLRDRVRCLAGLAPLLPAAQQAAVLEEAFAAVQLIGGWDRAGAVYLVASALPRPAPAHLAGRLLEAARTWDGVAMRANLLAQIAAALPAREAERVLAEALATARAELDANSRVTQLLEVAKILPDTERAVIAREAWTAARTVEGDSDRADLLGQAADLLPEAERVEAMTEAFEAANAEPLDDETAQTVIDLITRLPDGLRERAQASLVEEYHRGARQPRRHLKVGGANQLFHTQFAWANLLDRYAPFLPESDVRAALAQAWTIEVMPVRVHALAAVAPRLPPAERREVLTQAIATAQTAEDDGAALRALGYLAAQLPPELVADTVAAVRGTMARRGRAELLLRLAERLPATERAPLLAEALAAARGVGDEAPRAAVLGTMAGQLGSGHRDEPGGHRDRPGGHRDRLLAAAWQTVKSIPIESVRLDQVGLLARHMPAEAIQAEMLASLAQARSSFEKPRALATCAPYQAEGLLPAALAAARGLEDSDGRVRVLLALGPRFPGAAGLEVYREALAAARANEYETSQAEMLVKVAQAVPDELRPEALAEAATAARNGRHPHQRVNWLAALGPLAEGEEQRQLVAAALSAAAEIGDETIRAQAFETLAPVLPADFFGAALDVVAGIRADYDRARALVALAPYLPAGDRLRQAALAIVPAEGYPEPRIRALVALANQGPEADRAPLLIDALTAARSAEPPEARAELLELTLSGLPAGERGPVLAEAIAAGEDASRRIEWRHLADLPEPLRTGKANEWLASIRNMPYSQERAEALGNLLDGLPEATMPEALRTLCTCADRRESLPILQQLVTRWDAFSFEALTGCLNAYAETPRPQMLAALEALAPVLAALGGEAAVIAAAEAVMEAGEWWG